MIAVCLLTSGRADYTARTLASFREHNPDAGERFVLLHADDGSVDRRNHDLAAEHGFVTVWTSPERSGGVEALRQMWGSAARRGADRILHLENDFEWTGPVPDIEWPCVRLYGALKGRGDLHAETCPINLVTREPVTWRPHDVEGWERAETHFGGPPSVIATELLLPRLDRARVLKDIGLFTVDTIRPVENIVWHIGAVTTRLAPC